MVNQAEKIKKQYALKRYISYIKKRIKYIQLGILEATHNEYCFYVELYRKIKQWGADNKLIYLILLGKIKGNSAMHLLNITYERKYFRFLEKYKKELMEKITNWEIKLFEIYPFNPNSARFDINGYLDNINARGCL